MGAARRFCRFRTEGTPGSELEPLPTDGLCLSVFLVLTEGNEATRVLAGRIRPDSERWREVGALAQERAARTAQGWMLPACHLELFEAPDVAARRIAREQLGLATFEPGNPLIISDPYQRPGAATLDPHWDLHFIYRGSLDRIPPTPNALWREFNFVDPGAHDPKEFSRGHADILEFAGYAVASSRKS